MEYLIRRKSHHQLPYLKPKSKRKIMRLKLRLRKSKLSKKIISNPKKL
jgi:hypothetical protein